MYPIFQIASKEKTLHSYQFSYDVEDGVYENPVQTILQAFVKKDIIDCSSGFALIRGGKVLDEAIVVRPVRTTWLFLSKKTLDEIVDFLAGALDDQVKYTISEMTPQDNGFLFYFREADINSIDKELAEAIDAVSAESAAARVRYKDVLDFLHAKIDKVAKGIKVILLLLAMSLSFTTNAWADKYDNTTWACFNGEFESAGSWKDLGMTKGGTDYYYGTTRVEAGRTIEFKVKTGGSGWESGMLGLAWNNNQFSSSQDTRSGWYKEGASNAVLTVMQANSGWVELFYEFWGNYDSNTRVKIAQSEYKSFGLKHKWPGYENWGYKGLDIDNGDGTFSVDETWINISDGFNWHLDSDGDNYDRGYIQASDITKVGNPGENDKCRFTLSPKNGTVTVTRYDKVTYDLNGGTGVSAPADQEALYNTSITLAAMPSGLKKDGFSFNGWNTASNGSGQHYGASATISNLKSDLQLYAEWTVNLDVAKETGISSVSGSAANIALNSEHQISATPANGYHFGQWTALPSANATFADANSASTTVTVKNGSVTVTATGAPNTYNIVYPQSQVNYEISNNATQANYKTSASFTVTPAFGYLVTVTANQSVTLQRNGNTYTIPSMPAGDVTISVTPHRFKLNMDQDIEFDENWQARVHLNGTHDYTFKLHNAATGLGLQNDGYFGNSGAITSTITSPWTMEDNVSTKCTVKTGVEGDYIFEYREKTEGNVVKHQILVTYPDVSKINIDNVDYTLTQVGESNIYQTETFTLGTKNHDYDFYLYWQGAILGNNNKMTPDNHKRWEYHSSNRTQAKIQTAAVANGKYSFQFDASDKKLTAIYPTVIAGEFPNHSWDGEYTLDFTGDVGTKTITLVASQSAISFKVVDDGMFYGKENTDIIASTSDLALTPSNASSYDMKFTPSVDGNYIFTYNRSAHTLSVEYPTSTETYNVTVYQDGITPSVFDVGSTPQEISAVMPESMIFDKWVKEGEIGNVIIANENSATTTITATGAGASVRAVFKTSGTIYFKDNAGWGDVWLNFYSNEYWNNDNGSGAENIQHTGPDMHATKIDNTDIWYFNKSSYINWTSGIMAYTNINAAGHKYFNFVNCSYFDGTRGKSKFNDATPLFVVHNYITDYKNQSQYYLEGVWMKYNSTESGFDLRGKNLNKTEQEDPSIIWTPSESQKHKFTAPTPGEYTFSTTLHLLSDQTYEMRIYDAAERWYSLNGDMMTSTSCTNWKLHLGHDGNFKVKTTSEGDYVFTISVGGGEMLLTITYPLSDNDYRVVYVENTTEQTNGYLVKKISEGTQKDTASFFIATGATGQVKLQQCTDASTQTWADVSPAQTVSVSGKTNGVYNFIVEQNGTSATLSDGGKYTGDFYIRTQGVDGGLEGFKKNADNKLTAYASLLDAGITYDNFAYNYFKTKWVSSGKDVSFCVANDYSKNISSEFGSDAIINPVQTPTKETLPQSANVRFMWNSTNNTLKRAYISGSTNISDRFLVLEGDTKMFDKNGNALNISGLNPNEINFTDKNNWVYQADIKAQPQCAVKLTANYNNQVQYFLGASDASHQIISGTGSTQYTMRVVYDFKTNRLTAGWVPEKDQTITEPIELGGDMLLVREHQGDANQITFGDDGKVTNIKHIYGVLTIRKDTMLGVADTRYPDAATNADYSRTMYWISFPFSVKISEIFGLDGYGTKWIIQKYNGKKRADIGWFKEDTPTFWEFMEYDETLNAYEGYLFLIDATYFNKSTADVWDNSATEVNFYFPSVSGEIGIIKADTYPQPVSAHACGIDREFEVEGVQGKLNHTITDSYWNVIGVPAFQNTTAGAAPKEGDLKAYYEWVPATNTYKASATMDGVTFKTMHAYMVQFGGTLTWSNVSVVSNPAQAPYAYADDKNYRIELFFNGNGAEDHTYINLADGAHTDFELNEDMMKIDNAGFPNIYSFAGAYDVAYNETTFDNQSVMLGVSAPKNGSYTFAMPKDFSGKAVLVDLKTGEATDLNLSDYTVELNKGTYNNRFQLLFEVEAQSPTNMNPTKGEWSEDGKTKKLFINDNIYLINAGRIYNASGTQVK